MCVPVIVNLSPQYGCSQTQPLSQTPINELPAIFSLYMICLTVMAFFKQIDPPLYHAPATYKSSFLRFTLFTAIDHLFSSVLSSVMFFNHYASFHWWHCFTSWLEAQQRCSGWVYWLSPSKQIKVFCWPSCLWLLLIILPSVRTSKLITHFTADWPLSNQD